MAAIDDVLPTYDVHEVHSIALRLPPEEAIARVLSTRIASDPVVRLFFRLRGIRATGTIEDVLSEIGLRELARAPGEIVFGAAGRPWRPGGGIRPLADAGPGQVRMVADFRSDGERLTTETRVSAMDPAARRAFLRYWRVVAPFSGLIRRRWLKQIAR